MLEKLRSLDVELYLSQQPCNEEHLMLVVVFDQTNQLASLFLLLLFLVYKKLGQNKLHLLLFVAILITFTDQTTNAQNGFQRLRPCNNQILIPYQVVQSGVLIAFFQGMPFYGCC
jgi:undecaprenyl-diphosphatase